MDGRTIGVPRAPEHFPRGQVVENVQDVIFPVVGSMDGRLPPHYRLHPLHEGPQQVRVLWVLHWATVPVGLESHQAKPFRRYWDRATSVAGMGEWRVPRPQGVPQLPEGEIPYPKAPLGLGQGSIPEKGVQILQGA